MNKKDIFNVRGKILPIGERTLIMGILNVTPDSFYDGGMYLDTETAYARAKRLIEEGADIIDIGGESTRPGSDSVSIDTELNRILPILERLERNVTVPVSIDTTKAEVARQALEHGAGIVNDISALRNDPEMVEIIAEYNVPIVIMHMKGDPVGMQVNPYYKDVISEIKVFLKERIEWAVNHGIKEENIIVDPGIGFGKLPEHNLEILQRLNEFKELDRPILVGPSRKSFIGKILNADPEERLMGTAASVAVSVSNGADIVRVHDIKEMRQVVEVVQAIDKVYP